MVLAAPSHGCCGGHREEPVGGREPQQSDQGGGAAAAPVALKDHVKHAVLVDPHDSATVRFEYGVHGMNETLELIEACFIARGSTEYEGKAPKSGIDSELTKISEKHRKDKD